MTSVLSIATPLKYHWNDDAPDPSTSRKTPFIQSPVNSNSNSSAGSINSPDISVAAAALGVAAVTPKLSGTIKNKVAGPQTRRGSAKTLDSIRGAGATPENFGFVDEDDIDSQLGIG